MPAAAAMLRRGRMRIATHSAVGSPAARLLKRRGTTIGAIAGLLGVSLPRRCRPRAGRYVGDLSKAETERLVLTGQNGGFAVRKKGSSSYALVANVGGSAVSVQISHKHGQYSFGKSKLK